MRVLISFRWITALLLALSLPLLADEAKPTQKKAATRHDILFVCDCGESCACTTVGVKPGKCKCGKELVAHHVVKVEGTEALVCACPSGCTCKLDEKDATKCGCGKAVRRVDLKGSGLYFCNCGGSCACNTLKAKSGLCKCGMALKQAD
jgi:hypothetical protein